MNFTNNYATVLSKSLSYGGNNIHEQVKRNAANNGALHISTHTAKGVINHLFRNANTDRDGRAAHAAKYVLEKAGHTVSNTHEGIRDHSFHAISPSGNVQRYSFLKH